MKCPHLVLTTDNTVNSSNTRVIRIGFVKKITVFGLKFEISRFFGTKNEKSRGTKNEKSRGTKNKKSRGTKKIASFDT